MSGVSILGPGFVLSMGGASMRTPMAYTETIQGSASSMGGASIIGPSIAFLAYLAGLAVLVVVATIVSTVYHRITGQMPVLLRNLIVVLSVGLFAVSGIAVLLLRTSLLLAWLSMSIAILPIGLVSVYLDRTTGASGRAVITTAVMAWGVSFFLGVGVSYGVLVGLDSVLDYNYPSTVQYLAVGAGGLSIVLSMLPLSNRLVRELYSVTAIRDPSKSPTEQY